MNDWFKTCAKTAEIFREGSRINTTHKRNHTVGTCSNSWQEDPEQCLELPIYRLKTKKKLNCQCLSGPPGGPDWILMSLTSMTCLYKLSLTSMTCLWHSWAVKVPKGRRRPWSITFWPTATHRIQAKNVTLLFRDDLNHQRPSGRHGAASAAPVLNHTVSTCSNSWQEVQEQCLELPIYRL